MYQLKFNFFLILIVFIISLHANAKLILQSDSTILGMDNDIKLEDILRDPYIEVSATSKYFNIDGYELTHLKFTQVGKNKRQTYENFVRKYKKVVKCLVKNQIIPHENSMIHTGIHVDFISKKRVWEFSRVFVVYSDNYQLNKVLKYLEPFGLTTLKERLVMGYLNEKLIAIKAFTAAKAKLERFLKKKLHSKLQICYVIDIQIQGKRFGFEENIELQLKKQHNQSKFHSTIQIQVMNDKNKPRRHNYKDLDYLQQDLTLKVLFKLGQNTQNQQQLHVHVNQNNSHQSDDSFDNILDEQIQLSPEGEGEEEL